MIINYLNEGAFGSYKNSNKVSKEDRIAAIKKKTSEIIVNRFFDDIRECARDYMKRISAIYDNTLCRLYIKYIDDASHIYFDVDKDNHITVGVPMAYLETYVSLVPTNNFEGNFSIYKYLEHINNCIKNTEEVQEAADAVFGEGKYTFETKIYLLENRTENLKIHFTKYNEHIDFFKTFINLKFNLKTLQLSCVCRLVQGDNDLTRLEQYAEYIKSEYIMLTVLPRTIKSLHGIENMYAQNSGKYRYNTGIQFIEDAETKDLSNDEIKVLAKHFTWEWYPFSKELILELYRTEENFYEKFMYDMQFLLYTNGDEHEPKNDIEKAELYLKGLRDFKSLSFNYENGKVGDDVSVDYF